MQKMSNTTDETDIINEQRPYRNLLHVKLVRVLLNYLLKNIYLVSQIKLAIRPVT